MRHIRLFAPGATYRGLTLLEVLVALAVVGVIAAVAAPSMADMMERRRVVGAAEELVSLFNYAKSETNSVGAVLKIHLESPADTQASCARLTTHSTVDTCGCDYSGADLCRDSGTRLLREFILPKSTGVSFVAEADWGAAGHVLSFSRNQHYTDVQNARLTVTGQRTGAQLRVEYNNVGRVRICSPNGNISGFPSCG